jgi:hypothetical protein
LYTDKKISVISTNGNVLRLIKIKEPGESEGMVILPSGSLVVGFSRNHIDGYSNDFFVIKGFQKGIANWNPTRAKLLWGS